MKHNPIPTAHALGVTGAILYLVCAGWVLIARGNFMAMVTYWAHSVDMAALPQKVPTVTEVTIGLITFTAAAWATGYLFATVYNYFQKQ